MTVAHVPAFQVYLASKDMIQAMTSVIKERVARMRQIETGWLRLSANKLYFAMEKENAEDFAKGQQIGRVMQLSIAAQSVSQTALMAIDEIDLELINPAFFNPAIVNASRQNTAFAAPPEGHA